MQEKSEQTDRSENPPVAIIVVNYHNWQDTIECLESLSAITYPSYQIIVVDNHSSNDSIFYLTQWAKGNLCSWSPPQSQLRDLTIPPREKPVFYQIYSYHHSTNNRDLNFRRHSNCPELKPDEQPRLVIIESDRNGGFAAGNNIGIRYALQQGYDYFLLLNNDTVVRRDFLQPLVQTAREDKTIGLVGGKIMNYREPDLIWAAGGGKITSWTSAIHHIGINQKDGPKYSQSFECDYITGCLLLVKKEVIDMIGLMREEYFLYYEETDWNLRAKQAGYRRIFVPASVIYHKASVSLSHQNLQIIYYYTRNRIYMVKQNYHGLQRIICLCYLAGYNFTRLIYNLFRLKFSKVRIIMKAVWHGYNSKMGPFSIITPLHEG